MKANINSVKNWVFKNLAWVLLGCTAYLSSCSYYTNDYVEIITPDSVSFSLNVVPIFESKCALSGCHGGTIPPDLQSDVAYNNLIFGGYVSDTTDANNNLLYQKINGGSMSGFADDQDRAYIKQWIEDGAKNN